MAKRGIGLGMHPFGLENVKSSDGGILQPGKGGLLAYQDQYKQYPPAIWKVCEWQMSTEWSFTVID